VPTPNVCITSIPESAAEIRKLCQKRPIYPKREIHMCEKRRWKRCGSCRWFVLNESSIGMTSRWFVLYESSIGMTSEWYALIYKETVSVWKEMCNVWKETLKEIWFLQMICFAWTIDLNDIGMIRPDLQRDLSVWKEMYNIWKETLRQGWVLFERTCVFAGIQFTKHFIEFVLWKCTNCLVVIQTWSWSGKPAAMARAELRKANAERYRFIFPYKFGVCS